MNVTIIGGGNIGTAMAVEMAKNGAAVTIMTSHPSDFKKTLSMTDIKTQKTVSASLFRVTNNPQVAADAQIVFFTVPSSVFPSSFAKILPYLNIKTAVGIVPGTGGAEFFGQSFIQKGGTFFGFDRVPFISRLERYGQSVRAEKKTSVRISSFPGTNASQLCDTLKNLLQLDCLPLSNYLTITFTPSNPILHTSRLYSMYHDQPIDAPYNHNILFYEEWDDASSEMLFCCDNELQQICHAFSDFDLSGVIPLPIHYESKTPALLTQKIKSIRSFQGIGSPMKEQNGKYYVDLSSRYFTEDFPYGLCILRGFAEIAGVKTPHMDQILSWYESISGVNYFNQNKFCGKDLSDTAIPQTFGFTTPKMLYNFYKTSI